jgi:pyruvate-ferredoxin/flavodoxin oxidoreductase
VLKKLQPEMADKLMQSANVETARRFDLYRKLADMAPDCGSKK